MPDHLNSKPKEQSTSTGLKSEHAKHWVGMPDFEQEKNNWIYHRLDRGIRMA
jgi:hypothetical protein